MDESFDFMNLPPVLPADFFSGLDTALEGSAIARDFQASPG
jgi:hypothetical protein